MISSPVIVIGMHRSGTSLLARVLEASGVFMGVFKDHNFEAIHFLSLNQQALASEGGSWIDPLVPQNKDWLTMEASELYFEHLRVSSSLSRLKYSLVNFKWGWKDPRNSFTLNHWLDLYPKAKVIHLTRNKEAVVKSLMARNNVEGEVHDIRLDSKEFCISLVNQYVDQCRSYKSRLGRRYLEIAYEELVAEDKDVIDAINKFCSIRMEKHLKSILR